MQPEFEDEEAINPFDFCSANFKLKLKKSLVIGTMTPQNLIALHHSWMTTMLLNPSGRNSIPLHQLQQKISSKLMSNLKRD